MSGTYNIYCNESCHLENDKIPVMVLGAVWSSLDSTREIANRIREIKEKHGLSRYYSDLTVNLTKNLCESSLEILKKWFNFIIDIKKTTNKDKTSE